MDVEQLWWFTILLIIMCAKLDLCFQHLDVMGTIEYTALVILQANYLIQATNRG